MGGSVNLIDELNYAWWLSEQRWPGQLTPKDLVKMVTSEAARALEVQAQLGTIGGGQAGGTWWLSAATRPTRGRRW